jgi:HSP20 family protein
MNLVKNHRNFADAVVNEFFNRSISDVVGSDLSNSYPAVNIHESKDNFEIALAAPGLMKEDFEIHLEKNQLSISAKKETVQKEEGVKFTRREFNYTNFKRTFTLPETVDTEKINATYESGVLQLLLPKKAEVKIQTKNIEVV